MRFLLADGGTSTRFALCTLLEQQPGWRVVAEVSSGDQLFEIVNVNHPEILLLDWSLPGMNSEDVIPSLKKHYPNLAVIVMSGRPELKMNACAAGADAFVSKTEPPDKLLGAISTISKK